MLTDEQIIVISRGWNSGRPETNCGKGSMDHNTGKIRNVLGKWVQRYEIKTLIDAGAGDMKWIKQVNMPDVSYLPYDLVPLSDEVTQWDITSKRLPDCDAILCRYVLNHLPDELVLAALLLFKLAARYLILSTVNEPRKAGGAFGKFKDYNLIEPPFNLGQPLEIADDYRGQIAFWKVQ
jgi:hypothetical protein